LEVILIFDESLGGVFTVDEAPRKKLSRAAEIPARVQVQETREESPRANNEVEARIVTLS
jgi:hypothetical protein